MTRRILALLLLSMLLSACLETTSPLTAPTASTPTDTRTTLSPSAHSRQTPGGAGSPMASPEPGPAPLASEAPDWLGTRVLPEDGEGFGTVVPTPQELRERRIRTTDLLPPPGTDEFVSTIGAVPDEVLERSTWAEACPVAGDELAYVTVTFRGFDGLPHSGELLIARSVAADLVTVFEAAYEAGFPIEEMRVVRRDELDAPPTGDGNNTTGFVCRPVRGSSRWSQHALGLAVDVNPFHNPYERDELVLPELASAYTDRTWRRPGMLAAGGPVVAAFRQIGWHWGGDWERPVDRMHFSRDGG